MTIREERVPIEWPDDLAGKIATVVLWGSNLLALKVKTWRATWEWIRPRRVWCRYEKIPEGQMVRVPPVEYMRALAGGGSGVRHGGKCLLSKQDEAARLAAERWMRERRDIAARLAAGLSVEMIQVRPPGPPAPPKRTESGGPR